MQSLLQVIFRYRIAESIGGDQKRSQTVASGYLVFNGWSL